MPSFGFSAIALFAASCGVSSGLPDTAAATCLNFDCSSMVQVVRQGRGALLATAGPPAEGSADQLAASVGSSRATSSLHNVSSGNATLNASWEVHVPPGMAAVPDPGVAADSTRNQAPVARAGADRTVHVDDLVFLDGTASRDPEAGVLRFAWALDVPAGSASRLSRSEAARPHFFADLAGVYTARLTVTDSSGASATDTVTIRTSNRAPVARGGRDQFVHVGDRILLDGSRSDDPDADALTFAWSLAARPAGSAANLTSPGAGEGGAAATASFSADVPGVYTAKLVVTDAHGSSSDDAVTVRTLNRQPEVDARGPRAVRAGDFVALDGSRSVDPDGDALAFSWSLRKSPRNSSAKLVHAKTRKPHFLADAAGVYVAKLVVSDSFGAKQASLVTIRADSHAAELARPSNDTTAVAGNASQQRRTVKKGLRSPSS
eukprot:TRINITY_DN29986_c0_g1_i1.p1 TRINITY_DN29986_c0_g1~~TRINITY_DN29986_c0_g1_i1.p1  ORF type:complete len:434 (-),score=69.57 TRINITY_DN29986_c0_g1_i1:578-1879(-)